jgi:phosphoglycerate dehydrogenase-like enzyme
MSTPASDPQRPIQVIVAMDFSDALIERLRAVSPRLRIERHHPAVPEKAWAEAEIAYTLRTFPQPEQAPRLRWVQLHTAGVDHALREPIVQTADVEVTTTSGIHAPIMAEYCLMMMTAFSFRLPTLMRAQAAAQWTRGAWGVPLRGQTLGIVGYGSVGRELARLADALGMTVLAAKRDAMRTEEHGAFREEGTGDPAGDIPRRIYPFQAVGSMAAECDFLVVTAPLTTHTRGLISESVLAGMKKTAVLINVARGDVVDEAALISALAAEKIAGAGLDVFHEEPLPAGSPLWNMDNVLISPHISGYLADYHEHAAAIFIENLRRYLDRRPLLNVFNRELGY